MARTSEPNRKQVNAEIYRIVHQHEGTLRNCPSDLTVTLTLSDMVRELQAHSDSVVEAALAANEQQQGSTVTPIGKA